MKTVKSVAKNIGILILALLGLYLTAADWPEYFRVEPALTTLEKTTN